MQYGIHGKVIHCITDSGSNMVKAFNEFSVDKNDQSDGFDTETEPGGLQDMRVDEPQDASVILRHR